MTGAINGTVTDSTSAALPRVTIVISSNTLMGTRTTVTNGEGLYRLPPNDLTNAGSDGRYEFRIWSAKIHGTYVGPWEVRVTPFLRHQ